MPKVLLVNPRPAAPASRRASRSSWDRSAVRRVLNASGAWDLAERGGNMAHKKYGHHRRNPGTGNLLWGVAGAAGGFVLVSPVGTMVAPQGGILGYGVQAGVALGGGYLLGRWKKPLGWGFAIGGLASLAIKLYQDYVAGGAGMSYYADVTNPLQDYVTGNPLKWAAHSAAGAPALAAAAAAPALTAGTRGWSPRFQSRMFAKGN